MSGRQHGTRAKYTQDKCRCDECRAANTDYQRQRTRRIAPTLVDASRARIDAERAGLALSELLGVVAHADIDAVGTTEGLLLNLAGGHVLLLLAMCALTSLVLGLGLMGSGRFTGYRP